MHLFLGDILVVLKDKEAGRLAMKELNKKFSFSPDESSSTQPIVVKYYDEEYYNPTKLYVSHIAPDTTELALRAIFMPYGRVEEISLLRGPDGALKGYAFVKYSTNEEAVNAIKALHHLYQMEGAELNLLVKFSSRNDIDVVGKQRKSQASKRKRDNRMKPIYHEEASTSNSLQSQQLQNYAAYMQYYSNLAAYHQQQRQLQAELIQPKAASKVATTSSFNESPIAACNLYISNIPLEYSETDLSGLFGAYGPVKSVFILRDKQTGLSKGCALISFEKTECASLAIQHLNGIVIKGKTVAVSIKKQK